MSLKSKNVVKQTNRKCSRLFCLPKKILVMREMATKKSIALCESRVKESKARGGTREGEMENGKLYLPTGIYHSENEGRGKVHWLRHLSFDQIVFPDSVKLLSSAEKLWQEESLLFTFHFYSSLHDIQTHPPNVFQLFFIPKNFYEALIKSYN